MQSTVLAEISEIFPKPQNADAGCPCSEGDFSLPMDMQLLTYLELYSMRKNVF